MLRTSFRHLSVALIALAVVSVVGCAGERDPINRVQPNYVAKSYFDGEWHYASTLVPFLRVMRLPQLVSASGTSRV